MKKSDYTDYFENVSSKLANTTYRRGISEETLKRFGIGYDPEWIHPTKETIGPMKVMVIPTSAESYVVHQTTGDQKYGVGDTHIFNERALDQVYPVFVTEGPFDSLSIEDCGEKSVALCGTGNIKVLINAIKDRKDRKGVPHLILAFDNDEAGINATAELVGKLDELKISYSIYNVSGSCNDPNEAFCTDKTAFKVALKNARKAVEDAYIIKHSISICCATFLEDIKSGNLTPPVSTGFIGIDKILDGGLYPGLYVLGAMSSAGKTTLALTIADNIAAGGHDVLYISLEMATKELICKLLSNYSYRICKDTAKTLRQIQHTDFYKTLSPEEANNFDRAVAKFTNHSDRLFVCEGVANIGVKTIVDIVKEHIKHTSRLPVIIVDYLQILAPYNEKATDKQNADYNVLELKRLSRDYNVPILAISSFNRENYYSPVSMGAFKESGAIEYSADVLIGLQYSGLDDCAGSSNDAKAKAKNIYQNMVEASNMGHLVPIQAKVLKNRNGKRDSCLLDYYTRFNYFITHSETSSIFTDLFNL